VRLVLVEWEDSAQPIAGWRYLDDDGPGEWGEVVLCRSVGWLVHDDDRVTALAQNRGTLGGDVQVSGVIRIPTRSITRIVDIPDAG
jgi:hypothetical protein